MTSPSESLAIAELVTYIILIFPMIYLIIAHGKRGILGWLYVFIFAILRMISSGLTIGNPSSTAGEVISSVGISPLLLALAGILHETHIYFLTTKPSQFQQKDSWQRKFLWCFQFFLHVSTSCGVVLIAVGTANLNKDSGTSKYHTDLNHRKVGSIILLFVYILICIHMYFVYRATQVSSYNRSTVYILAKRLFQSIMVALPLVLVRLCYTIAASFASPSSKTFKDLNPQTASLAVRVIFPFLIPLLAAFSFVVGGLASRKIKSASMSVQTAYPMVAEGEPRMDNMMPKQ